MTATYRHNHRGHSISELGPALLLFMLFILPLLNLVILPIRYLIANEIIDQSARHFAQAESFSDAVKSLDGDDGLRQRLVKLGGVNPVTLKVQMNVNSLVKENKSIVLTEPGKAPKQWLPDGKMCPCSYTLELVSNVEIAPAVVLNLPVKIPGLSAPMPTELRADDRWENRSRNPVSRQYYLDE